MKRFITTKMYGKVLILSLLVIGLGLVASNSQTLVGATTCDDLFGVYDTANNEYSTTLYSLYFNSPTSCATDCVGSAFPTTCENNCQTARQNAFNTASYNLERAAVDTCYSAEPDFCAGATAMADQCFANYHYVDYSDTDQRLAVYTQYADCILASKVDTCR